MAQIPQLAAYLRRIGLGAQVPVSPEGLAHIQSAHRQVIPFENLSIRTGEGVSCESGAVLAKLVTAKRGGFCFEHNQLLADMLGAAGFDVRLLLARVLLGNPRDVPPRTHCLVLVTIEGEDWIADAGFGGAYAPPMRLADGAVARSSDGAQHRLTRIGEEGALPGSWVLERMGPVQSTDGRARSNSEWEAQFAFEGAQVAPSDMALGCHWAASHESSRFTQATVVSRCLPDGFASLVDHTLSIWSATGDKHAQTISSLAEYDTVLNEHFAIALSHTELDALRPLLNLE